MNKRFQFAVLFVMALGLCLPIEGQVRSVVYINLCGSEGATEVLEKEVILEEVRQMLPLGGNKTLFFLSKGANPIHLIANSNNLNTPEYYQWETAFYEKRSYIPEPFDEVEDILRILAEEDGLDSNAIISFVLNKETSERDEFARMINWFYLVIASSDNLDNVLFRLYLAGEIDNYESVRQKYRDEIYIEELGG